MGEEERALSEGSRILFIDELKRLLFQKHFHMHVLRHLHEGIFSGRGEKSPVGKSTFLLLTA